MREISNDSCEQEVFVDAENAGLSNPVSKWLKCTLLAVGMVLASCGAPSLSGSSKQETQMPKKNEETSPYSKEVAQEIQRLYMGLARRMYMVSRYGEIYRYNGNPQSRQACLEALSEANRFFETMILHKRFNNERVDAAMRVVQEQTKVRLELLKNNCKFKAPVIFQF